MTAGQHTILKWYLKIIKGVTTDTLESRKVLSLQNIFKSHHKSGMTKATYLSADVRGSGVNDVPDTGTTSFSLLLLALLHGGET